MRIGELASRTGIGVETIRFYETKGLLPAPVRQANNYRVYGEMHVARLHFIRHCRALDISLEDIAKLCAIENSDGGELSDVHKMIDTHLLAVKKRIAELMALQYKLEQLKSSCTGDHACKNCGILEGLEAYDKEGCDCCKNFVEKEVGKKL